MKTILNLLAYAALIAVLAYILTVAVLAVAWAVL